MEQGQITVVTLLVVNDLGGGYVLRQQAELTQWLQR